MELRSLRYFIKIVELGSLSQAAQALFVAQPALSHQVAALEAELEVRLLDRSPRGVKPTPAGLALYKNAVSIVRQVEGIRAEVKSEQYNVKGEVSFGIPTSTAVILAVPLLEAIVTRFPHIRLEINENGSGLLAEWLMHGRLDLAILFTQRPLRSVRAEPLLSEELCLVSPAAAGAAQPGRWPLDTVRLDELDGVRMVLSARANGLRRVVHDVFVRNDIYPNVIAELSMLHSLKGAVLHGLASTVLPMSAVLNEWMSGRLVVRKIIEPTIARPMALCSNTSIPLSPAAEAVNAEAVKLIGRLVRDGAWPDVIFSAVDEPLV